MEGQGRKYRLRYVVTAALGGLLIAGLLVVEFGVDVDWYRPQLEAKIREFTGLPAHVAGLDFSVLPKPAITASKLTIGDGAFRLDAPRVLLVPRIRQLVRGVIAVRSVDVEEPVLRIPEDRAVAREQIADLVAHIQARPEPDSPRDATIDVLHVRSAVVGYGDELTVLVRGDATVREVLSELVRIELDAAAPMAGPDAEVAGELALDLPQGGVKAMRGTFTLADLRVDSFSNASLLDGAALNATVEFESDRLPGTAFAVAGDLAWPRYPDLAEDVHVRGQWDEGVLLIHDGQWSSPGAAATFTAAWQADEGLRLDVIEGRLRERGLQTLLAAQADTPVHVESLETDAVTASQLTLIARAGEFYVNRGQVVAPGFRVTREGTVLAETVRASIQVSNNVLSLEPLEVNGLTLRGEVNPNFATGTTTFDLAGGGTASDALLLIAGLPPVIQDVSGTIDVESLKGTYTGEGFPADFRIEATLQDGALTIVRDELRESITQVRARAEASTDRVEARIEGASGSLGALSADLAYELDAHRMRGVVRVPLQHAPALLTDKLEAPASIGAALAAYGSSELAFDIELPDEVTDALAVSVDRQGEPALKAAVQFVNDSGGRTLGDVEVTAQFPATALEDTLPSTIRAAGPVDLVFRRSHREEVFAADLDLSRSMIAAGDFLEKIEGARATIAVSGAAPAGRWQAHTLKATVLDEELTAEFVDDSFVFENIDIQLASIAPLVKIPALSEREESNAARGRIRGRVATAGPEVALRFTEVSLPLSADHAIERLDGAVQLKDDRLAIDDLEWNGLNSQFSLSAQHEGADWRGTLQGSQLDIDAFLATLREVFPAERETREDARDEAAEALSGEPWVEGALQVALDRVLFEDVVLERARAEIVIDDSDVRIENLVFVPGDGEVRGRIEIRDALDNGPATYDIDVALERVPSEIIDAVQDSPDRGVEGPVSGEVDLELPQGDLREALADAEGTIHLTGRQGTFGRMGLATKVLGVLRTTGVFSLRAPFSRRGGLAYRDFETTLEFEDGVMEIEEGELQSSSYTITAKGTVDFEQNESNVRVNVDLLEGVTGLAERVPILGQAVGLATKPFDLRLRISGSPFDVSVREATGEVAQEAASATAPPVPLARRGARLERERPAPGESREADVAPGDTGAPEDQAAQRDHEAHDRDEG